MSKVIDIHLRLEVEERKGGTAEELERDIVSYLTGKEAPLREDYGPNAWGGYDGAYVTSAWVVSSEVT